MASGRSGCDGECKSYLATVHQPLSHNAALSVLADRLGDLDIGLQTELAHSGVLCKWIGMNREIR